MANESTEIKLGLAAGRVYRSESSAVHEFMAERGFVFWSPEDIKSKVVALAKRDYENDPAIITAKIVVR